MDKTFRTPNFVCDSCRQRRQWRRPVTTQSYTVIMRLRCFWRGGDRFFFSRLIQGEMDEKKNKYSQTNFNLIVNYNIDYCTHSLFTAHG